MFQPLDRLRRADEAAGAAAHDVLVAASRRSRAKPPSRRPGRHAGIHRAWRRAGRFSSTTSRTCGMTSPARWIEHGVADADVLARDLVLVVQRRVGDDDAADRHRIEPRDRRQRAGAADIDLDAAQDGRRAFAGNLCATAQRGERETKPSRCCRSRSIDFVDDAVDVVAERGALRFDRAVLRQHLVDGVAELASAGWSAGRSGAKASSMPHWVVAGSSLTSPQA